MLRTQYLSLIARYLETFPIVALLGPRQCGKTTLANQYQQQQSTVAPHNIHYFDLENPVDLARLDNPYLTLNTLQGLIIIDEIQRRPELFPLLRVLVDKHKQTQQWLILGSASKYLIQQSSESLAGRIAYIEITPFTLQEMDIVQPLWLKGGFPPSYLANTLQHSLDWRKFYIQSFLEQDIPNLGLHIPAHNLRRFWMMLAHYHANLFNASEIGRSLDLSAKTIKHYLDILTGTFMIRTLQPWFENISKRQVKTPKVYLRDSGILHSFLGITDETTLQGHPKLGASWEGFALEEIIRYHGTDAENCYFWATHSEAELDLMILENGKRLGFEFKFSDAPKYTKSMHIARETLGLDSLTIIYPGEINYELPNHIKVIGLRNYIVLHEQ